MAPESLARDGAEAQKLVTAATPEQHQTGFAEFSYQFRGDRDRCGWSHGQIRRNPTGRAEEFDDPHRRVSRRRSGCCRLRHGRSKRMGGINQVADAPLAEIGPKPRHAAKAPDARLHHRRQDPQRHRMSRQRQDNLRNSRITAPKTHECRQKLVRLGTAAQHQNSTIHPVSLLHGLENL